jgi:hypothetical protein
MLMDIWEHQGRTETFSLATKSKEYSWKGVQGYLKIWTDIKKQSSSCLSDFES